MQNYTVESKTIRIAAKNATYKVNEEHLRAKHI